MRDLDGTVCMVCREDSGQLLPHEMIERLGTQSMGKIAMSMIPLSRLNILQN